jgi:hypothetical protein
MTLTDASVVAPTLAVSWIVSSSPPIGRSQTGPTHWKLDWRILIMRTTAVCRAAVCQCVPTQGSQCASAGDSVGPLVHCQERDVLQGQRLLASKSCREGLHQQGPVGASPVNIGSHGARLLNCCRATMRLTTGVTTRGFGFFLKFLSGKLRLDPRLPCSPDFRISIPGFPSPLAPRIATALRLGGTHVLPYPRRTSGAQGDPFLCGAVQIGCVTCAADRRPPG